MKYRPPTPAQQRKQKILDLQESLQQELKHHSGLQSLIADPTNRMRRLHQLMVEAREKYEDFVERVQNAPEALKSCDQRIAIIRQQLATTKDVPELEKKKLKLERLRKQLAALEKTMPHE